MPKYETTDLSGDFAYRFVYSKQANGWTLDSLDIERAGKSVLSKRALPGAYGAESLAIAQGIQLCETVVAHLRTKEPVGP